MINVVLVILSAKDHQEGQIHKKSSLHDRLWNSNMEQTCLFEQRKLASKKIIEPTDIMVN